MSSGRQFVFHRPDIFLQPLKQRLIVAVTAQNRHCGMIVGIEKRRHHRFVAAVNQIGGIIKLRRDFTKTVAANQKYPPGGPDENVLIKLTSALSKSMFKQDFNLEQNGKIMEDKILEKNG